jgi:hypothetical protein
MQSQLPVQSQQDGLNLAKRLKKCRAKHLDKDKICIPLPELERELERHIKQEYR